jgi:PPOX class probable F420-dependent enzyme
MQTDSFEKARYLSLTTFRRDGRAVATAVWFVPDGDRLLVVTGATSGKAKRLRNDGRVLAAPCDMRGRPAGDQVEGTARLQDAAGSAATLVAVKRRYGVMARFFFRGGSGTGSDGSLVGIEIVLDRRGRDDGPAAGRDT